MTIREWTAHRVPILAFFDNDLRHKRIDLELGKAELKSAARAESGSRGGTAKALKNKDVDLANATVLLEQKATVALASSSLSLSQSQNREDPYSLELDRAALAPVNGDAADVPVLSLEKAKVKRQKPDDEDLLQEMVGLWQDAANELGFPQISEITPPRQAALRARIRDFRSYEFPDANQGMQSLIAKIRGSPFLTGQTDAAFRASFDWILKPKNFHKIMDGNYEAKTKIHTGNGFAKHGNN